MNIYKIVLTGGPCAGKTDVIKNIKEKLEESGYYIVTIPETASNLIKNKIYPQGNKQHTLKYQELVLLAQLTKEQIVSEYCKSMINNNSNLLKNKKGIIVLCDRGIMDNRAYLSHKEYNDLLKKFNLNELNLLDSYDLAINLISTATAKPELYQLNGIRYETVEVAAQIDEITSGAWLLHKNLITIKPTNTIEDKINIVFSHIIDFIEQRQSIEITSLEINKENTDLSFLNDNNSRKIKITYFYIKSPDKTKYILCKKEYNENVSFTIKQNLPIAKTIPITYDTYHELQRLNLLQEYMTQNITYFIYKGNIYYLIEDNKEIKLYTVKNNANQIPKNISLKKSLIKNNNMVI